MDLWDQVSYTINLCNYQYKTKNVCGLQFWYDYKFKTNIQIKDNKTNVILI